MSGNKSYLEECNHHTNTMVEIKSVRCICCSYFFLSQVIFGLLLLLGMLMYANEVETIRKIKIMLGKINYNIYIIFNKVKSLICRNSKGIYSM